MNDIFKNAVKEVCRRYQRSLSCIAGYAVGSAFVVAIMLLQQLEIAAKSEVINYMGTHFVAFSPAKYSNDGFVEQKSMPLDPLNEAFFAEPMVVTSLLPIEFASHIASLPEVLAATPFLLFRMKQGQDGHVFSIGGINPADEAALKGTATTRKDIISGAFFGPKDRGVVLVEETYALMWDLKVGSIVNIADTLYPVIGIVRPGVRPVRADIFMNWPDAEAAINKRVSSPVSGKANLFLVESAGIENHAAALEKVEKLLPESVINTFNCSVPAIEVMGISGRGIHITAFVVSLMILLFAAISQWTSVRERSYEIAVLKAIGWKNQVIVCQIIFEALILAAAGLVPGAAGGFALFHFLAQHLGDFQNLAPESGQLLYLLPLLVILYLLLAILTSALPSMLAVKTSPAVLLRNNQTG